ncbi:MAG: hypothetical protein JO366_19300 [Methylobacteriaceae bacterium]|nr:hypothetical protein [Methylobacteriaceae bacterium]MBV9246951.1 hypothetical protein [Methylobacteriaceae bacterium]MBV9636357.1 hypothetical protein [Methylobacteriaceae bacterium]
MNTRQSSRGRTRSGAAQNETSTAAAPRTPGDLGPDNPVALARYIAEMTAEMAELARNAKLEFLAYLLAMAQAEGEKLSRSSSGETLVPSGE